MTRREGPWNRLREPRVGVMLHYDGSLSDRGALEWLLYDPRCRVSYNFLILDDGTVVTIAPFNARAWHAGVCAPSATSPPYTDANSAFYGIAFAATSRNSLTPAQRDAATDLIIRIFRHHGWTDVTRHLTDHHAEAMPRKRKTDITDLANASLGFFREQVTARLRAVLPRSA